MAEPKKTRKINDVIGIDFGTTSTKLVRLRKSGSSLSLLEADVMEPWDFSAEGSVAKLSLKKKLQAPYAGVCITASSAHVRFLFVPSKQQDERTIQNRVRKSLGLGNEFRVGYSIVRRGKEGVDHKVLATGIPGDELQRVRKVFASNNPSMVSLEVSGLAALNSFSHTEAANDPQGAVCYIEAGAESTMISFFLEGEMRLVRKFDSGASFIQRRIQDVLNINEDDALTVLFEDATPLLEQALDPVGSLLQEVSISQKFVERNENTRITKVFASGGLSYSPYWLHIMSQTLGREIVVWDPFAANGIKSCPRGVRGVESMFAPAMGAALSVLNQP